MLKWIKHGIELLLTAAVIAAAAWFYWHSKDEVAAETRSQAEPPVVVACEVVAMTVRDTVHSLGTLRANESVELTATVTEKIVEINFEEGQPVEAGTVLVQLTNREQKAVLEQAQIVFDEAKREFDRVSALYGKQVVSSKDYDAQGTRLAAAVAAIELVEASLRDRVIVAPFDGVLGRRMVSKGHLVSPGVAITTLDDIEVMKVDFDVPEKYFSQLRNGLEFRAAAAAYPGRSFTGTVLVVDPRINPVTRSIQVRGVIANDDLALRPGMLMAVDLELADRVAIEIPEKAVQSLGELQFVFVMERGVAVRRPVELGARAEGRVEVVSGLAEGEAVVIEGVGKLRDGMIARLADAPARVEAASL